MPAFRGVASLRRLRRTAVALLIAVASLLACADVVVRSTSSAGAALLMPPPRAPPGAAASRVVARGLESPVPDVGCTGPCCESALWRPVLAWQFRHWRPRSVTLDDLNATLHGTMDLRGWPGLRAATWRLPGHVVTILNGRIWIHESSRGYSYEARADLIARLLWRAIRLDPASPAWLSTRFLVDTADLPLTAVAMPVRAPSFAHSCFEGGADVCAPDHTHEVWTENGVGDERGAPWDALAARIAAASDARPYASRVKQVFFRGRVDHRDREAVLQVVRASRRPELYDVAEPNETVPRVPLVDASRWAVQLSIPGNGYQARLKYALATGSPTIVMVGGAIGFSWEWWWWLPDPARALTPFVHYWPIRHEGELEGAVEYLLGHPDEAEAMGAAGRAFVLREVTARAAQCYWSYALRYWQDEVMAEAPVAPFHGSKLWTPPAALLTEATADFRRRDTPPTRFPRRVRPPSLTPRRTPSRTPGPPAAHGARVPPGPSDEHAAAVAEAPPAALPALRLIAGGTAGAGRQAIG